jgi:membrane protein DedA with SNARE-associated domain
VSDALRLYLGWFLGHPYVVIFFGTLIDAIGFPFPGRVLLVAAGAFAAAGNVSLALIIVLGALGAMLTDHAWYFAGARNSRRLQAFYCRLASVSAGGVQRADGYFHRFGAAAIVIGRFSASVRIFVWPFARRNGVGYGRFLAGDLVGALLWATIWAGLGYLVGDNWESLVSRLGTSMVVLPVLAAVIVVAACLYRRAGRRTAAEVAVGARRPRRSARESRRAAARPPATP